MGMSVLLLGLAATAVTAAAAAVADAPTPPPSAADGVAATRGLLERLLGAECAGRFEPSLLHPSACSGETKLCFGYGAGSTAGTVALRGTSGVELAMAANHYLKYVANVSVSWENTGGVQAFMAPGPLPAPAAPVHVERSTTYHYYANVCTFSYSFVWYTLEDWVREIDWMALNGVNLPLAYTGQEKIYQKLYNAFGVSNESLSEYFAGPAFLAWNRGQGLLAWGGKMDVATPGQPARAFAKGLPQAWIDAQWELQRQILPKMRAFGMKPVLPGFQGNVPNGLMAQYPSANISRVGKPANALRDHYACAAWIDALDPLFTKLSDAYMKILIADFGTDHMYAADGTFSHASAPWMSEGQALGNPAVEQQQQTQQAVQLEVRGPPIVIDMEAFNHSKAAYAGMSRTDPQAVWLFQTWSWLGSQAQGYMKGWITAVPNGSLILLDLMAEESPLWKRTQSYYGAPFLWCMLNDFGGNNGMWGDFESINAGPAEARAAGATMIGTGLTPEGIWQNAVAFDLMNENSYRSAAVSLEGWVGRYADRRYGAQIPAAAKQLTAAWQILRQTAYNGSDGEMVSKDTVTAIPYGRPWDKVDGTDNPRSNQSAYDDVLFLGAWKGLLAAAEAEPALAKKTTFVYDLVDVGRQALAKYSSKIMEKLSVGIAANDTAVVKAQGADLLSLLDELDTLLGSSQGFLFGAWVASSEKHGTTAAEKELMRWNAKTQVTFWEYPQPDPEDLGGVMRPSNLQDYACKQWAGLIRSYYRPRWELFINQTLAQLAVPAGKPFDVSAFYAASYKWFDQWQADNTQDFATEPAGDAVALSKTLEAKYSPLIAAGVDEVDQI